MYTILNYLSVSWDTVPEQPHKAAERLQRRPKTFVCRMSCKPGCMLHLIFCSRNCINMEMISDQRSQRGSEKITKNYLKVQHFLTYVSIAIIHWQLKVPPLSEFKRNEYEILFFKEMHLQPPCQCLVNTLKRAICHSSAPNAWEKNSWYWALLSWI